MSRLVAATAAASSRDRSASSSRPTLHSTVARRVRCRSGRSTAPVPSASREAASRSSSAAASSSRVQGGGEFDGQRQALQPPGRSPLPLPRCPRSGRSRAAPHGPGPRGTAPPPARPPSPQLRRCRGLAAARWPAPSATSTAPSRVWPMPQAYPVRCRRLLLAAPCAPGRSRRHRPQPHPRRAPRRDPRRGGAHH